MVLMSCVSEYKTIQRIKEVDSVEAIVDVTPRPDVSGWVVELDILVYAPLDVEVSIPSKSTRIGSLTIVSQGFGGGGSSDGSTMISRSYNLEPDGFGLQSIPVMKIPYIDKRVHPSGENKVLYTEEMRFLINRWY
jgi:hypothetical protein